MMGYIKQVLTIIAAAFAGYVFGIFTAATRVPEKEFMFGGAPEWYVALQNVSLVASGGCAVAVIAWIYVDYKYEVKA